MAVTSKYLAGFSAGTLLIALIAIVLLTPTNYDYYYSLNPNTGEVALLNKIDAYFSGMELFSGEKNHYLGFIEDVKSTNSFSYCYTLAPSFHTSDMVVYRFVNQQSADYNEVHGLSSYKSNTTIWFSTIVTNNNRSQQILIFNKKNDSHSFMLDANLGTVKNLYTSNGHDFIFLIHIESKDKLVFMSDKKITFEIELNGTYNGFVPNNDGYFLANTDNSIDSIDFEGNLIRSYPLTFEPFDIDLNDDSIIILDNN